MGTVTRLIVAMIALLSSSAMGNWSEQDCRYHHKPPLFTPPQNTPKYPGEHNMQDNHQQAQWNKGTTLYNMLSTAPLPTSQNYQNVCDIHDISTQNWLDNFNDLCNDLTSNTIPRTEQILKKIGKCGSAEKAESKSCNMGHTKKFVKKLKTLEKNTLAEENLLQLWKLGYNPLNCVSMKIGRVDGHEKHCANVGRSLFRMNTYAAQMKEFMDVTHWQERKLQKWLVELKKKADMVLEDAEGDFTDDAAAKEFWEEIDDNGYYNSIYKALTKLIEQSTNPMCKRFENFNIQSSHNLRDEVKYTL